MLIKEQRKPKLKREINNKDKRRNEGCRKQTTNVIYTARR